MSPPTQIAGRYVIERRLGAGGMSTVFQANDTVLERPVAVKLLAEHLADDDAFVARFRREALAAARLQHPNIVQVFDSGEDSAEPPPLHRHGVRGRPLVRRPAARAQAVGLDETVHTVRDACHGLDYAHRAGVIHRDVKPGNLLVAEEMSTTKLADFGIAKAAEQTRITQVGSVLGTAAYLSPEQARGDESRPASDIYSLGVCAYQFLTGRLPHEYASLTELALKQQQNSVTPITDYRPEVPTELDAAIRLCLEREPGNRYATALEMAKAIEAGVHGETTAATRRLALSDYDTDSGDRRHRSHAGAPLARRARARSSDAGRAAPGGPAGRHARGGAPRPGRDLTQGRRPSPLGHVPGPAGGAGGHRRGRARPALPERQRWPHGSRRGRRGAADPAAARLPSREHATSGAAQGASPASTRLACAAKPPVSIASRMPPIRRCMKVRL